MAKTKQVSNNMRIWDQAKFTDPDMTEKISFGAFKFTTIDAQYQLECLTKMFGPCGDGWGITDSSFDVIIIDPNDSHYNLLKYEGVFWYRLDGEIKKYDIVADIELFEYVKKNDDWRRVSDPTKKVRTDALTKGISWLGFNADVFMGKFDNNKYIAALKDRKQTAGEFSTIKGANSEEEEEKKPAAVTPSAPAKTGGSGVAQETVSVPVVVNAVATTKAPEDIKSKVSVEKFKTKTSPEIAAASDVCKESYSKIQTVIDKIANLDDKKVIQSQLDSMVDETFGYSFFPESPGEDLTLDNYRNVKPYLDAFYVTLVCSMRLRRLQKIEEQSVFTHKHLGDKFLGKLSFQLLNEASKMVVANGKINNMKTLANELKDSAT